MVGLIPLNQYKAEKYSFPFRSHHFSKLNAVILFENRMSLLMTKPTKWHLRPAKTQLSLGIRPD